MSKASGENFILHHLGDSHCGPIILLSTQGIDVFMPSKFFNEMGERKEYKGYFLTQEDKIISTDISRNFIDLSITKNVLWMFLSLIILFLLFLLGILWYRRNSYTKSPHGIINALEMITAMMINSVIKVNIGERKYKRYLPFLLTLFYFIWINNVLGLLPGAANVTGSISVTACLAFFVFIVVNCSGTKHYYKELLFPHLPKFLYPIIVPIEVLGVFIKPITLMIRLFANMMSGHIVILSIISIAFVLQSFGVGFFAALCNALMLVLKLLVSFLQAYIFVLLSSIYIGDAVKE